MPYAKRMMVFVDGENLVMRYQSMLERKLAPTSGVKHERDGVSITD